MSRINNTRQSTVSHRTDRHFLNGLNRVPKSITLLALAALSLPTSAARAADLEVQISGFRNSTGQAGCQIFASSNGFPRDGERALSGIFAAISTGTARCVFTNLPAGRYAVAVMHDENSNKKLDSNLLGIPSEGYGVSNNRTYATSSPKWEESRFELAEGEKKSLGVQLRY